MTATATLDCTLPPPTPRARVVSAVRRWIQTSHAYNGERLPSIQSLAAELEVSRPTVRAAFEELRREGVIRSRSKNAWVVGQGESASITSTTMLTQTVGILSTATDQVKPQHRQSGWWSHTIAGTTSAVAGAGLHAMVINPATLTNEHLQQLLSHRPTGLIVYCSDSVTPPWLEKMELIRQARVPLVVYGDHPDLEPYDSLTSDHEAGAYQLTRWLLSKGRRRIQRFWAFDADEGTRPNWIEARDRGFVRAMNEAGLEPLPLVEHSLRLGMHPIRREDFEVNTRIAASFLISAMTRPLQPDAIMLASDGQCEAVSAALRLFGCEPGKDVTIVGYDNYWRDLPFQWEPVQLAATVDKRNAALGEGLVQLLMDRAAGRLPNEPQHRMVEPQMIVLSEV